MADSLCWECKNACGKCSWSSELKPIDNWVATKDDWSYTVIKCPKFEQDNRPRVQKIRVCTLAKILHCARYNLNELDEDYIVKLCKKQGFDVLIELNEKNQRRFYVYA